MMTDPPFSRKLAGVRRAATGAPIRPGTYFSRENTWFQPGYDYVEFYTLSFYTFGVLELIYILIGDLLYSTLTLKTLHLGATGTRYVVKYTLFVFYLIMTCKFSAKYLTHSKNTK